jgi:DNA-binding NtrC family response regulator
MNKILIVDDEVSIYESLKMVLGKENELLWASNAKQAMKLFHEQQPRLILLDIILPGIDGIEILGTIREYDKSVPIIMLTATKMVKTAVDAMKRGATDYIIKPFDVEELRLIIARVIANEALEQEVRYLRSEVEKRYSFHNLIGKSHKMREIYVQIEQISGTKSTVLITGESGTGKELVARAIHYNSPRKEKTFVPINCAAIPESLIESELFGYEKGAFTNALNRRIGKFERAHKGTLFLDEIGDLSTATQAKILRVLQEKEFVRIGGVQPLKVDVRIIAATNKNLEVLMEKEIFRNDLYYRINVVSIHLPPLRDRREDIPLLVLHLLKKKLEEKEDNIRGISREAIEFLMKYSWPGNVRELENVIEQIVALSMPGQIEAKDLPSYIKDQVMAASLKEETLLRRISLEKAVMEFEKEIILDALKKTHYIQTHAANLLGITRRMLRYKMDSFGIKPSETIESQADQGQ